MNCELCGKSGFDNKGTKVLCGECACEMLHSLWKKDSCSWKPSEFYTGYYYPLTSLADETVIKIKAEKLHCPQCGKEHF